MDETENTMSTAIPSPETQRLRKEFIHRFAVPAELLIRAPGRVNLIGEHTDYNGYPVMPLAIDREIRIAAIRRTDDRVHLHNCRRAFAERSFALSEAAVPFALGDWGNYVKAAVTGLQDRIPHAALGFTALVDGRCAGCRPFLFLGVSSPAPCCFSTSTRSKWIASSWRSCWHAAERFVGTAGGGMVRPLR
jgi:hypothetical protein